MAELTGKGRGHKALEGEQSTVDDTQRKVSTAKVTFTAGRKISAAGVRKDLVAVLPARQFDKANLAGWLTRVQTPH